jgi:hypothetical protein
VFAFSRVRDTDRVHVVVNLPRRGQAFRLGAAERTLPASGWLVETARRDRATRSVLPSGERCAGTAFARRRQHLDTNVVSLGAQCTIACRSRRNS